MVTTVTGSTGLAGSSLVQSTSTGTEAETSRIGPGEVMVWPRAA